MSNYFAEKSWPESQQYIDKSGLIIPPIGPVEEHGSHLPAHTRLVIADGIAKKVSEALKDKVSVLVMPGFWTGYSVKKMNKWPGVISIRSEILTEVFYDLMASLIEMGFKKLLTINAHGQNPEMIKLAARRIMDTYDINVVTTNCWSMAGDTMKKIRRSEIGGALHGGEFETSLMLYLTDLVDMSKATDEDIVTYHSEFYPGDIFGPSSGGAFLSTWAVQESTTGIYGDPTVATKETGRILMEGIVEKYARLIDEYMSL